MTAVYWVFTEARLRYSHIKIPACAPGFLSAHSNKKRKIVLLSSDRAYIYVTRTRYRGFDFPNIIESHRSLSFLGYTPPLTEANLTHLTEGAFRGLGLSGHELEAARISQIPRGILQYADTRHAAGNGEPQRARLAYW